MRDEHKTDADGPAREIAPHEAVPEDGPVASHECDLDGARPPCGSKLGSAWGHEVQPRQGIEVEARQSHDGVVCVFLVGDEEVGGGVPDEGEVIERAENRFHVCGGCGEEGHVLEIGVVLGHVSDEMVHVVRGLPPADGEPAAEICDEGSNERVVYEVSCDTPVAGIMGCEHDLLPKCAENHGGCEVPFGVQEGAEESKKK